LIDDVPARVEVAARVQIDEKLRQTASRLGTATLHEAAGQIGALPSAIRCLTTGLGLAGPAVTVNSPPGDNLWIHRAIYSCCPGDVLVVTVGGVYEAGYWGELMSHAARARGLAGVVLDGCARDGSRLKEISVPVFGRGLCIRGTTKRVDGFGTIGSPVSLGSVVVRSGDFIVGDDDGVVALPSEGLGRIVARGEEREVQEADVVRALRDGARTLDLFGLPD
jgi:4-hydroxy-4-methyl-2-oxoglutarate aldolase